MNGIDHPAPDESTLHHCAALLAEEQLPDGWEMDTGSGFTRVAHHRQWQIYYREFPPPSPLDKLRSLWRGSDATRAWNNNQNLRRAGFGAPPTLVRGRRAGNREYIFTGTANGERLAGWIKRGAAHPVWGSLRERWQLLQELGVFIGRLHATGFIHGNLQTHNILVHRGPRRFEFSLINNESNAQITPAPGKSLLKNLMELNMHRPAEVSRSERLRFFRAWHSQMRDLTKLEARLLAREAYGWAVDRLG